MVFTTHPSKAPRRLGAVLISFIVENADWRTGIKLPFSPPIYNFQRFTKVREHHTPHHPAKWLLRTCRITFTLLYTSRATTQTAPQLQGSQEDQQIWVLAIDFSPAPCDNFRLDVSSTSLACRSVCLSAQINYQQEVLIQDCTSACEEPRVMSAFFTSHLWSRGENRDSIRHLA